MHGDLHLTQGKSAFCLTLPRCEAEQPIPGAVSVRHDGEQISLSDKYSVLYVEDNMSNRALVEAIVLRHRDLRIHCVATIKEAKRYLKEVTPALLLLDLNLPDGSGESLVSHLQSNPQLKHIPIMVLSADALPDTIARLEAMGIAHYMTKPLDVAVFNKQIRALIAKQEAT
jgi:CheY-like chemotaxis protein